ncbi:hypothetical protein M3Y94_00033200 [Aphelenchoides besseyi]|nr:hypothetical protein M3Y94_00033200 [Aphelenchoides besseyi]KAI6218598.1 hypothetical protein M3Y95_01159700 [Aphelenchoides besseyi]
MFWFIFISCFVVKVASSVGNNKCIENLKTESLRGFYFRHCDDAEIALKWKKHHELGIHIHEEVQKYAKFKLILNDVCELEFERVQQTHGYWKSEIDGLLIECEFNYCHLTIDSEGKLKNFEGNHQWTCRGESLRNKIDDLWLWTRVRLVSDRSRAPLVSVYVWSADKDEGEEYKTIRWITVFGWLLVAILLLGSILTLLFAFFVVHRRYPYYFRNYFRF